MVGDSNSDNNASMVQLLAIRFLLQKPTLEGEERDINVFIFIGLRDTKNDQSKFLNQLCSQTLIF